MATFVLTAPTLTVSFSVYEKVAGLLRDITVPLTAITSVTVVPDGLRAARGLRAPGLGVPGVRKIGTWRGRSGGRGSATAVSVRAGQPAVRIGLQGTSWSQLLIGHDDAARIAADLRVR